MNQLISINRTTLSCFSHWQHWVGAIRATNKGSWNQIYVNSLIDSLLSNSNKLFRINKRLDSIDELSLISNWKILQPRFVNIKVATKLHNTPTHFTHEIACATEHGMFLLEIHPGMNESRECAWILWFVPSAVLNAPPSSRNECSSPHLPGELISRCAGGGGGGVKILKETIKMTFSCVDQW